MKPFAIPDHWSPQQAMAVVDFLDELRCHIWQRYEIALLDSYRDLCGTLPETNDIGPTHPFIDDPVDF
jgi:hypothetical protein